MRLAIEIPHNKHGSAIFTKANKLITSVGSTNVNDIEILTVEMGKCTITSVYKPPNTSFIFNPPANFYNQNQRFVLGDFNSHSISWGYQETDINGQLVTEWAETNNLALIHDPKLPPSFHSRIWKRGYNPDLCFASTPIEDRCIKMVYAPVPKSQHRPVGINIYSAIKTQTIPFRRRFNFRKADWNKYESELNNTIKDLKPIPENYEQFVEIVKTISRQTIPRGCRQQYIHGMSNTLKNHMQKYSQLYEKDPFSEETVECGSALLKELGRSRQEKWVETLQKMDMTHSSKIAWNLIKKLNGDPKEMKQASNVTADQVAHTLLENGKTQKHQKTKLNRTPENGNNLLGRPFTLKELNEAINSMKNGKAAGIDDLCTEQIKHFGKETKEWILQLMNACCLGYKIPKSWRKAKIIALLKPGKDPELPGSYRPISLLCHLFKIFERLILMRTQSYVDGKIIPQQGGFRPGRSCTGQVLALTEFIESGFEQKFMTGVAFVDLSAAYDTVNHRKLLTKVYQTTKDFHLTKVIESILQNRRFYVTLEGKKSRWRLQKNGLPQGSVLAPMLFNIYTNDQPTPDYSEHFLYADDLAVAVQDRNFENIEQKLEQALATMSKYYKENSLRPNPSKTQVCAFHLHTRSAGRKLRINWEGSALQHEEKPRYLGVTLDRSLTYKHHCLKTKQKVATRNHLLRKLCGSKWGANPIVLRTTAQALCYSTGEYASPVWSRSAHAKHVDVALNETCRIITGCMKPTPTENLYKAAGFAAPSTRRKEAEYTEKFRQFFDDRHPLYGTEAPPQRLKSRKSFLAMVNVEPPDNYPPKQEPPTGSHLEWKVWKTLNRIRCGVAPVKTNLIRWGHKQPEDALCECGEIQSMEHLLNCHNCPHTCTLDDLWLAKENAIDVARYWAERM